MSSYNDKLRVASGEKNSESKLESFLYELMRDHLPTGVVQTLVNDAQSKGVTHYTNGYLAEYAHYLAEQLK